MGIVSVVSVVSVVFVVMGVMIVNLAAAEMLQHTAPMQMAPG